MDLQNVGSFLAQLRKEQGLTQEQLGEKLGVSNKTVSRWENGNYLPPVEVLQLLADLYGLSINEVLSGQRLDETQFREKAEENICGVLSQQAFTFRQRLEACRQWLRKYWWTFLFFLLPAAAIFSMLPHVLDREDTVVIMGISICLLGVSVIGNHLIFHATVHAHKITGRTEEFRTVYVIRTLWLILLLVMAFVIYDLLVSFLYMLTPAGSSDGYHISSRFYDILFEGNGDVVRNHFGALTKSIQFAWMVLLVNIDLTILWMKRK